MQFIEFFDIYEPIVKRVSTVGEDNISDFTRRFDDYPGADHSVFRLAMYRALSRTIESKSVSSNTLVNYDWSVVMSLNAGRKDLITNKGKLDDHLDELDKIVVELRKTQKFVDVEYGEVFDNTDELLSQTGSPYLSFLYKFGFKTQTVHYA